MSKVTANTELAVTNTVDLIPSIEQIDDAVVETGASYLPFLELVYPIMQDEIYEGHMWELGFRNGGQFERLEAGTILSVLDIRKSIKREYIDDSGKNKNEYAYQAISRGAKGGEKIFNKSAARYEELLPEANDRNNRKVNLGNTVVVIALFPDGKTAVIDFSGYKTIHGYLIPALTPAKFREGGGLKIKIDNHKPNLVKSKTTGHMYPSVKKFGQWDHVVLTKEQGAAGAQAMNLAKEAYMSWIDS